MDSSKINITISPSARGIIQIAILICAIALIWDALTNPIPDRMNKIERDFLIYMIKDSISEQYQKTWVVDSLIGFRKAIENVNLEFEVFAAEQRALNESMLRTQDSMKYIRDSTKEEN